MTYQKLFVVSILLVATSLIGNAQAQSYGESYHYGNDHYKVYPDQKKGSDVNIQKIKCVNSNVNVNGIDISQIPQPNGLAGTAAEATNEDRATANTENGNGLDKINFKSNLVNVCANVNANEQIRVIPPPDEEPIPTNLDLAVTNFADDDVSIRLGNGDGTFTSTAPDVTVGNVPSSIAVGLFNADSNLDLAVANRGDDDVSIRLGNGDGTFTSTAPDVTVGDAPISIAVGDFDNT